MPLDNSFFNQISDAIVESAVSKGVDSGKLDKLVERVTQLVGTVGTSTKALNKLHKLFTTAFQAAVQKSWAHLPAESGVVNLPSGQQLTNISNKLFAPLFGALQNNAVEMSKLHKSYDKQLAAESAFRTEMRDNMRKLVSETVSQASERNLLSHTAADAALRNEMRSSIGRLEYKLLAREARTAAVRAQTLALRAITPGDTGQFEWRPEAKQRLANQALFRRRVSQGDISGPSGTNAGVSFFQRKHLEALELVASGKSLDRLFRTPQQKLLESALHEARTQLAAANALLKERTRSGFVTKQPSASGGYRSVRPSDADLRKIGPDAWYTKSVIAKMAAGDITARGMHPAHSTQWGVVKGSGMAPESTPSYLGASSIAIGAHKAVLENFIRIVKPAIADVARASFLANIYVQQAMHQQRVQEKRGRTPLLTAAGVKFGDDLAYNAMSGLVTRVEHLEQMPGYDESERFRRQTQGYSGVAHDYSEERRRLTQGSFSSAAKTANLQLFDYVKDTFLGNTSIYPVVYKHVLRNRNLRERDMPGRNLGLGSNVTSVVSSAREKSPWTPPRYQESPTSAIDYMRTQSSARPSIYIAGPMRGIPELNFPEFDRHEARWTKAGWNVVNPANMDRTRGYVPSKTQTSFANLSIEEAMSHDLPAVASVNAIGLMRGWEKSQGANIELGHARTMGKMVFDAETMQLLEPGTQAESLLSQYQNSPSAAAVIPAMQMSNALGPYHDMAQPLMGLILAGQKVGRQQQDAQRSAARNLRLLGPPTGLGTPIETAYQKRLKAIGMDDPFSKTGRLGNKAGVARDFLPDPYELIGKGAKALWQGAKSVGGGARAAWSALNDSLRSGGAAQSSGYPRPAADVRAKKRSDALADKFAKLEKAVENAQKSLASFSTTTKEQRKRTIKDALDFTKGSVAARQGASAQRLGFASMDAEQREETALKYMNVRRGQLAKSGKYKASEIENIVNPPYVRAQLRTIRAQYADISSAMVSGPKLDALRKSTAEKYARTRYPGTDPVSQDQADTLQKRIESMLGGPTAVDVGTARVDAAQNKAKIARDKLAADLRAKRNKVREERSKEKTGKAAASHKAALDTELAAGRGGTGSRSGSGSGGGPFSGSGRSGAGFGMSWMLIAGYDTALKSLVKNMAEYSARTQMMEFATNQMAKAAGLNTGQVDAEVESIKKLNVTTQVAQQTVQRMMMMQLDLSKATKLVSVAQDLAAISGADAMETVSRLTQAVLTGYTRNLHMMGLQVTSIGANRELLAQRKAEGKTGAPTVLEQRSYLTEMIIREGVKFSGTYERSLGTVGGQFAYLSKQVQETENVLGKEFLPIFTSVMLAMSSGLGSVQKHAEGFGGILKTILSLSSGLSVLGTSTFLQWMLGAGTASTVIAGAAPFVAIGTAIVAHRVLNPDAAATSRDLAAQQRQVLEARRSAIHEDLNRINLTPGPLSSEQKNARETDLIALKAYAQQELTVEQDLTANLAREYARRIADIEAVQKKKPSVISMFWNTLPANISWAAGATLDLVSGRAPGPMPFPAVSNAAISAAGGGRGGVPVLTAIAEARKKKIADDLSGGGISSGAIVAEYARQQLEASVPATMINDSARKMALLASEKQAAIAGLEKYENLFDPVEGPLAIKALKAGESAREKGRIDYEAEKKRIDSLYTGLDEQEKTRLGTPEQRVDYEKYVTQVWGNGNYTAGLEAITKAKGVRETVGAKMSEVFGITSAKADEQTAQQKDDLREQTELLKIQGETVRGNYASEREEIEKTAAVRKKYLYGGDGVVGMAVRFPTAVDRSAVAKASAEAEQADAKIAMANRLAALTQQRVRSGILYGGEEAARVALSGPGTAEQQLQAAYLANVTAAQGGYTDEERPEALENLRRENIRAGRDLAREQRQMAAEQAVSIFETAQGPQLQAAGILGARGLTTVQQQAAAVARAKAGRYALADVAYQQQLAIGAPEGTLSTRYEAGLLQARDTEKLKADAQAVQDTVSNAQERVNTLLQRFVEYNKQRVADQRQVSTMFTTNAAVEIAADQTAHDQRLKDIDTEEAKAKDANNGVDEAERDAQQERHDLAMQQLQMYAEQYKKVMETIGGMAGDLFMIAVSRKPTRARQLRDFWIDAAKDLGKNVTMNAVKGAISGGGAGGGAIGILGKIFPHQTNSVGNPTWIGRALSGTIFQSQASKKQIDDAKAALAKATQDAKDAPLNLNTTALEKLTAAINELDTALGAAKKFGTPSIYDLPGNLPNLGPITLPNIGGYSPLSGMRLLGSPTAIGSPIDIVSVGGGALSRAVPVYLANSPNDPSQVAMTMGGAAANLGALAPLAKALSGNSTDTSGSPGLFAANALGSIVGTALAPAITKMSGGSGGAASTGNVLSGNSAGTSGSPGLFAANALGSIVGTALAPTITKMFGGSGGAASTGNVLSSADSPGSMVLSGFPTTGGGSAGNSESTGPIGANGAGEGSTWSGTDIPNPSGAIPVRMGPPGSSGASSGSGFGVSNVALMTAGTTQAISAATRGGPGSTAKTVGGVLTAASAIPGPLRPLVAAGAMIADLIGLIQAQGPEQRGNDITNYLNANKFLAPTQISREVSSTGNLVSTSAQGLTRNTDIAGFPIPVIGAQYGQTPKRTWANPLIPEYYDIPGQVENPTSSAPGGVAGYAAPLTQYPTVPSTPAIGNVGGGASVHPTVIIQAMDSSDVLRRSADIAAALNKEVQAGHAVVGSMQRAMFGQN